MVHNWCKILHRFAMVEKLRILYAIFVSIFAFIKHNIYLNILYELVKFNFGDHYRCPNCDRSYKRKAHLVRHLRIECNVPPALMCILCSRGFRYKHTLKRHEAMCIKKRGRHIF
nr:unnamed protein product [Callosobruchus analis]